MPKSHKDNAEPDKSEINLLPETLRTAEKKLKRSMSEKDHGFEQVTPKKDKRKRKKTFLSIFGVQRWGTPKLSDKEKEEKIRQEREGFAGASNHQGSAAGTMPGVSSSHSIKPIIDELEASQPAPVPPERTRDFVPTTPAIVPRVPDANVMRREKKVRSTKRPWWHIFRIFGFGTKDKQKKHGASSISSQNLTPDSKQGSVPMLQNVMPAVPPPDQRQQKQKKHHTSDPNIHRIQWWNPFSWFHVKPKTMKIKTPKLSIPEINTGAAAKTPELPAVPKPHTPADTSQAPTITIKPPTVITPEKAELPKPEKSTWSFAKMFSWLRIFDRSKKVKKKKKEIQETRQDVNVLQKKDQPISPSIPAVSSVTSQRPNIVVKPPVLISPDSPSSPKLKKKSWSFSKLFGWLRIFDRTHKSKKRKKKRITISADAATSTEPPIPTVPPSPIPPSGMKPPVPTVQPIMDQKTDVKAEEVSKKNITPLTPHIVHTRQEVDDIKKEKKQKGSIATWLHVPEKAKDIIPPPEGSLVNLIPGQFMLRTWQKIGQLVIIAVASSVFFMAVVYILLHAWQVRIEGQVTEIDRQIQTFRSQILAHEFIEERMAKVGQRIALVQALLARHIYWTDFFELLEKYTLEDVYYDGISAGTNGNISLSAHGRDYTTVAQQLKLLLSDDAKEFVTFAAVNSATLAEGGEDQASQVTFSIEVTLNSDLFFYD